MAEERVWVKVDRPAIPEGRVTTVIAGDRAICLVHGEDGTWSALDNRCPHQGGPLGDGQIDEGWLICPWHAYQYDTVTGRATAWVPRRRDAVRRPVRRG